MTVELRNESAEPVDEEGLRALAVFAMRRLHLHPDTELSVVCVTPDVIAELHEQWLDEPGPTDVLSFPMDELRPGEPDRQTGPGILGDVVLCPVVAQQQAVAAGRDPGHEQRILLAHGILHLLGYDHVEPEEEAAMFSLQRSLVADFERAPGPHD